MESCNTIESRVDAGIGLIIATCPDKQKQNELFDEYINRTKDYGKITASAFVIGSLLSYLKETMDLTKDLEDTPGANYTGRPKVFYLMELDFLLEKFKNDIIQKLEKSEQRIEAATALSLAYYPDRRKRETLFKRYLDTRDSSNQLNASILASADLMVEISKEFELTENAFGGF